MRILNTYWLVILKLRINAPAQFLVHVPRGACICVGELATPQPAQEQQAFRSRWDLSTPAGLRGALPNIMSAPALPRSPFFVCYIVLFLPPLVSSF